MNNHNMHQMNLNRNNDRNTQFSQINQTNQFVLNNQGNGNVGHLDIEFERTKSLTKHVVVIDSLDRNVISYPTQTSYRLELPTVYKQVKKVRLLSMEISSTFYIFKSEYNNTTLHISIYDNTNTYQLPLQEITIPDGNYDLNTIGIVLTDLLNANELFIEEGVTFNVSVDQNTFLLNIITTPERITYIDTTYVDTDYFEQLYKPQQIRNWGLEYYLGFTYNAVSTGRPLVATQLIKLNPYNYMILDIKELNRIDEATKGLNTAFAKIPITTNSFELITLYENCCTFNQAELNPYIAKLGTLTISWRFHDNRPINFNNIDHSFTLELECLE